MATAAQNNSADPVHAEGAPSISVACFDCLEEYNIDQGDGLAGTSFDCTCGNSVEVPAEPWPQPEPEPSARNEDAESAAASDVDPEAAAELELAEDTPASDDEEVLEIEADIVNDDEEGNVEGAAPTGAWADHVSVDEHLPGSGYGVGGSGEASNAQGLNDVEAVNQSPEKPASLESLENPENLEKAKSDPPEEPTAGSVIADGARIEYAPEEAIDGSGETSGSSFFAGAQEADSAAPRINLPSSKLNLPDEEESSDGGKALDREILTSDSPERALRNDEGLEHKLEIGDGVEAEPTGAESAPSEESNTEVEVPASRPKKRVVILSGILVALGAVAAIQTLKLWPGPAAPVQNATGPSGKVVKELPPPKLKQGSLWPEERQERLRVQLGLVPAAEGKPVEPFVYPEGISEIDKIDMMPYRTLKKFAEGLDSLSNKDSYEWAQARLATTFADPKATTLLRKWLPRGRPVGGGPARKAAFILAMHLGGRSKGGSVWGASEAKKAERKPGSAQLYYAVARVEQDPYIAIEFANKAFSRNKHSVDAQLLRTKIFLMKGAPVATPMMLDIAEKSRDPGIAVFAADALVDFAQFKAAEGLVQALDVSGLADAVAPAAESSLRRLMLARSLWGGKLDEAEAWSKAKVEARSDEASAARVFIELARLKWAQAENGSAVLETAVQAASKPAGKAGILVELLDHHVKNGQLPEAKKIFMRLQALPKKPTRALRDYGRGLFAEASGNTARALKAYRQAGRRYGPAALGAARLLGKTSVKQLGALAKRTQHVAVDMAYARALRDDGLYGEAEDIFSQVLWNYPVSGEPISFVLEWLDLLVHAGEGDRALALLRDLLQARPKERRIVEAIIVAGETLGRTDVSAYWRQRLGKMTAPDGPS